MATGLRGWFQTHWCTEVLRAGAAARSRLWTRGDACLHSWSCKKKAGWRAEGEGLGPCGGWWAG